MNENRKCRNCAEELVHALENGVTNFSINLVENLGTGLSIKEENDLVYKLEGTVMKHVNEILSAYTTE